MDCQIGAFWPCLVHLSRIIIYIIYFKKEKRKLTKSRIFKIMHLFSKLGAFSYALSLFSKTNQVNHPFSKKEERNLFVKIKGHHA